MDFMEQAISWLQTLPPVGVLALMFLIAYVENIFPPSPSDVALVFAGTLIGIGVIGFAPALIVATLGSVFGFMTAYILGRYFEQHFVSGRYHRFLPVNAIHQVERLFNRFGYGVIVANRFLAGTRAFVSFFAGMSKMDLTATTLLSAVSAAVWNSILLYLGMVFANNWRVGAQYLALYSKVATVVFGVAVIVFLWRYFRKRRRIADSGLRIADSQPSNDEIKTVAPIESENRDQTAPGKNQSAIRNPQSAIE
jgi:membrane protein DedA with SNARE-associated domain